MKTGDVYDCRGQRRPKDTIIRKSGTEEASGRQRRCRRELRVAPMILVGVAALARPNAAGGVPYLFVGDGGAGWACEVNDFETFEADFAAPFFKIGGRVIERVAEFNQHV